MAKTITPVAGVTPTLWWFHSDPAGLTQTHYHVQVVAIGGTPPASGTTIIDTGKTAGAGSSYLVAPATLTAGCTYKWRVSTFNTAGYESERALVRDDGSVWTRKFSDWSYFRTVTPPVMAITAPLGAIATPTPTVTWTYAGATAQSHYYLKINRITAPADANVYESGTVPSAATSHPIPIDELEEGISYGIFVAVYDQDMISNSTNDFFNTSYALPAGATAVGSIRADLGLIRISSITGGAPTFRRVRRRLAGIGSYVVIGDGIAPATTSFDDITAAAGQSYDYSINNVSATNQESANYTTGLTSLRVDFPGTWLIQPTDRTLDIFLPNYSPPTRADAVDTGIVQPLDRNATVVELGAIRSRAGSLAFDLVPDSTDSDLALPTTNLRKVLAMRDNELPVWLKGNNPESAMFVSLLNVSVTDLQFRGQAGNRGYHVVVDFREVEE